ncbi:Sodium/calcium exchanger protein-domain-containing protein [Podospora didyma]|uniref:Sodium/calcium exchanger protein-domain-containing protein n=1 Tax=Podospora didyma TaxID=330526 RepID=A0AAE0NZ37_9PEZI|nr:Sodium/calcium exchanger protein-domain-containing protein [Podospora didyma]
MFEIKRMAHSVGRENSSYNPFSFTHKKGGGGPRLPRNETWDASNQLEGQRDMGPEHSATWPPNSSSRGPSPPPRSSPREGGFDDGEKGRTAAGSSKENDAALNTGNIGGEGSGGETSLGSSHQAPNTESQNLVRRRTEARSNPNADAGNVNEEEDSKPPKKQRTFFKHLTPKEPFTVRNQIHRTLFNSWINLLLLAAPVGIAINYVHAVPRVAVFVINFIAIVPLAAMLSFATEEIALRTGETLGGLLNATFGNAVELIVAVIALIHNEVVIVQTSLIGSILSNLLLVLGMCFFCGGLNRQEQFFNTTVAQTAASLLALAVAAVIVPTVFDLASETSQLDVAKLSRGTSLILLFVYAGYLLFQLKTHSKVFSETSQKVEGKPFRSLKNGAFAQGVVNPAGMMGGHGLLSQKNDNEKLRELLSTPPRKTEAEEGEGEEPQLHFIVAVATLAISTIIIAFCAEYMVDGISAVTEGGAVSAEFVGLILLPIVGNAAEHATAVTVAIKDKMDLAIGVAVGSSMQVALFIIPLLVIIGWGMGMDDMSLSFDPFQVAVLFVSVLLVNYLIADGKSHWLEGMLLICLYLIIAVCSWCKYPSHLSPLPCMSAFIFAVPSTL